MEEIKVCQEAGRSTGRAWQGGKGQNSGTRRVESLIVWLVEAGTLSGQHGRILTFLTSFAMYFCLHSRIIGSSITALAVTANLELNLSSSAS